MNAQQHRIVNHEGRFAGHDGMSLYYQSWLDEAMPPRGVVLIVHGLGEHSGAYQHVVDRLAPAGFALFAFDLRGHGRSPGQRGFIESWDDYRQDVRAFLRFITMQQPDRPLYILGHSLGGVIVLDYALRFPDKLAGVIAIGPAIGEIGISPVLMAIARVLSRVWPSVALRIGLDVSAISRDPQVTEAYRADPLVHDRGTARLGTETEQTVAWVQAHAADLRVPLLIQHGESDRIARPDGSRRFLANVVERDKKLIEYAGGFHQVHNDLDHEVAISDLLSWLQQHVDATAASPVRP